MAIGKVYLRVLVVLFLVMPRLIMAADSYFLDEKPIAESKEYLDEPSPAPEKGNTISLAPSETMGDGNPSNSRDGGFLASIDVYDQARPQVSRVVSKTAPVPMAHHSPSTMVDYKVLTKPVEEVLKDATPSVSEIVTGAVIGKYFTVKTVSAVFAALTIFVLVFFLRIAHTIERFCFEMENTIAGIASDLKARFLRLKVWIQNHS